MRVEDDVLGVQFVDSTAYVEAMVERYIERYEVITNVDPDIDVTVTIPARPISRDDMDYHIFVDVELEWRIASEWGMHEWIESWRGESLLEMTAHAKIKGAKRMVFEE